VHAGTFAELPLTHLTLETQPTENHSKREEGVGRLGHARDPAARSSRALSTVVCIGRDTKRKLLAGPAIRSDEPVGKIEGRLRELRRDGNGYRAQSSPKLSALGRIPASHVRSSYARPMGYEWFPSFDAIPGVSWEPIVPIDRSKLPGLRARPRVENKRFYDGRPYESVDWLAPNGTELSNESSSPTVLHQRKLETDRELAPDDRQVNQREFGVARRAQRLPLRNHVGVGGALWRTPPRPPCLRLD
jgi:hypothetical protein